MRHKFARPGTYALTLTALQRRALIDNSDINDSNLSVASDW
jgi:hypothetical protein